MRIVVSDASIRALNLIPFSAALAPSKIILSLIGCTVVSFAADAPVSFRHEIVPIFSKYGCNGGGCHGKAEGQNGFKLSLLGFEPQEDYAHLVTESRGRRLMSSAPEFSLLLRKASGELPHGGGARIERDSADYKTIVRWLEQGAPNLRDD